MLRAILTTDNDRVATALRVALGIVMLPHGLQKVFGWFGGGGLSGTIGYFDQSLGVPAALTVLVISAEFLGSLGLIAGLLSRVAAVGISLVMLGAIQMVHWDVGFFMNWTGTQPGEGFEFHILALALALAVVIKGSGAYSVDRLVSQRLARTDAPGVPRAAKRRAA